MLKEESAEEDESQNIEEADDEDILPKIEEVKLEPEEVAELVDEKVLERAISDEMPPVELTEDEKEIFSYFMPIAGMENTICQGVDRLKRAILATERTLLLEILLFKVVKEAERQCLRQIS